MGFVFYDVETTGTNSAFDQILQFAAILTDHDLKEIDRFEIRSRLLPYVTPSPGAIEVTGITVEQLTDPSLPSYYEMVSDICKILNEWSPAIFIGHNSISFDEHFMRQAFYQTLHPPYLTNTNGNCRSDSIRMIQATSLFAPNSINIPSNGEKNIYKLDKLAPANGFKHTNAHDALADVEATIHMCQLLEENAPQIWSNFIRFAQKSSAIDYVVTEDIYTLADCYYGNLYSWIVTTIGPNPDRNNEIIVFDLSHNPDELAILDDVALAVRLAKGPKPVRCIRANACPMLFSDEDAPDSVKAKLPDPDEVQRRVDRIKNDSVLSGRLIDAFLSTRGEKKPAFYVEQKIYEDFTGQEDTELATQFHEIDWTERLDVISELSDDRLKSLGQRLIYTERQDLLTESTCHELDVEFARRLMGIDGAEPWLTLPKAIQDTDELIDRAKGDKVKLLKDLRKYLTKRAEEATILIED